MGQSDRAYLVRWSDGVETYHKTKEEALQEINRARWEADVAQWTGAAIYELVWSWPAKIGEKK